MSRALDLLRRCATPAGFVAADTGRANYRRIWSRDGCVSGLAALVSGEADLVDALRRTLVSLRQAQGPSGQIPSNVSLDGRAVSYGGSAGRVDATLWYVLVTALYGRITGEDELLVESWPSLLRAVEVLRAWEHNEGGLVYVPQAGDWADEYVLSGYLLYDQALRLWALRELDQAAARLGRTVQHEREHLAQLIADRYGAQGESRPFFTAGFHAGGEFDQFDAFGNALCCGLGLGSDAQRRQSLDHAARLSRFDLVPAFDPVIEPGSASYELLERAAGHGFRNRPGRYHNGGLWPVVTGFWALAARQSGDSALAARWTDGIVKANQRGDAGFPEFLDRQSGEPGGVSGLAWSAAGQVIARSGDSLLGRDDAP